jgi:hypothetical protein
MIQKPHNLLPYIIRDFTLPLSGGSPMRECLFHGREGINVFTHGIVATPENNQLN